MLGSRVHSQVMFDQSNDKLQIICSAPNKIIKNNAIFITSNTLLYSTSGVTLIAQKKVKRFFIIKDLFTSLPFLSVLFADLLLLWNSSA